MSETHPSVQDRPAIASRRRARPHTVSWRTAWLSFRALFNWNDPGPFLLAMVATPLCELLFYSRVGRAFGAAGPEFYVLGGAMLAACTPSIAGGAMSLSSERYFGTLEHLLLSGRGRGRVSVLLTRAVPYAAAGLLAAVLSLLAGMAVLRTTLPVGQLLAFVPLLAVGALSATYFGMALGVGGLVTRGVFTLMNIAFMALALGAGLLVPAAELPGWLTAIAMVLPMRHAATAERAAGHDPTLMGLANGAAAEALVAGAWAAVAVGLFTLYERRMHRGV
ncbi:ABC transporter permease [Streptomyces formicae]|uniref:ABC transporter permease n=1 Tax=Streptomyces formicae TaxID=1616117 RepID=UPI00131BF2F8|nr:ABC transporter permease [Streptomyces formicae]